MKIISRAEARAQGFKHFYTGKPCNNGHVERRQVSNGTCGKCSAERTKKWVEKNKEYRSEYNKEWHKNNREERLAYHSQWYRANKDWKREYDRKWREENREYKKQRQNEYSKRRRREDPRYAMMRRIRGMLERLVYNHGISKESDTCTTLGYTVDDLQRHLERQFTKGMSWANYGKWHIDHIIPVSVQIRSGETDPAIINCLTNLRPMWAADNAEKRDRVTHLL